MIPTHVEQFQSFCLSLKKDIYTVTYWLAQLFVTRNSLKARHAAVTKFARAQTFDGFVGQKALYAIDLSIVIV